MYSPHLKDQVLDFYGSYVVDNSPLIILLVFSVISVIFVLRFLAILTGT